MKKNIINSIFGLAVASLMLTACSSADDAVTSSPTAPATDDTAISFGAYLDRNTTRGGFEGELTTDILKTPASEGFGVMAYYTDNQPYTPNAIPNFMYNQQVLFDTDHWAYSPLKYWPNEFGATAQSTSLDRLSFFAYAPYTEVDPVTGYATDADNGIIGMTRSAENGNPKVRYYASFDPAKRVDLCWAKPQLDAIKPDVASKVTFNFKHALASLNIQIDALFDETTQNAGALDPKTRIWVRSVTFEGLAMKGELNLNNRENTPEWNDLYSNGLLIGEPVTIYDGRRDGREGFAEMPNEKPVAINTSLVQRDIYDFDANDDFITTTPGVTTTPVNLFQSTDVDAPIFVIPTGEPLRVTIVYDVETVDWNLTSSFLSDNETNGSSIENCITKVVESAPNSPISLDAGKKYVIKLHLGMTSVKLDVKEVKEWANGDNVDTDLPGNTPGNTNP